MRQTGFRVTEYESSETAGARQAPRWDGCNSVTRTAVCGAGSGGVHTWVFLDDDDVVKPRLSSVTLWLGRMVGAACG